MANFSYNVEQPEEPTRFEGRWELGDATGTENLLKSSLIGKDISRLEALPTPCLWTD